MGFKLNDAKLQKTTILIVVFLLILFSDQIVADLPMLTLADVANNPQILTEQLQTGTHEQLIVRPLMPTDAPALAQFLESLSLETRRLSSFSSYDRAMAQELCDAIARYDKLRFVLENPLGAIIGLLEYSFWITEDDRERYASYNIQLSAKTDCRFGPTLSDAYQNQGIGSLVVPFIKDVAQQFGRNRLILWGGVLADNPRAIRYYEKNGFQKLGIFENSDHVQVVDMILNL